MADAVEIDLYADDLEQEFTQEEFVNDGIDLYDDVVCPEPGAGGPAQGSNPSERPSSSNSGPRNEGAPTSVNHAAVPYSPAHSGRRYQLYVGNLTWWTTDQDITDAILGLGINDFIEVKFFEDRSNGRSKGFCLVSLGSEQSMRICMERMPKKELHGQSPVVTYATKQALNKFESQTDTRPTQTPHNQSGQRMQHPGPGGMGGNPRIPPGHGIRSRTPPSGMAGPPRMPPGGPHMSGPPPHGGMNQLYPYQNNWQNGMRQNGPPRPPGPPQAMQQQRPGGPPPGMFQGPPPGQGMPRGPPPVLPPDQRGPPPRPDWNRPPVMQGPGGFIPPHQHVTGMQGPPGPVHPVRVPPPNVQGGSVPPGGQHVNPPFFPQGGPPMQPHAGPPPGGAPVPPQVPTQGPPGQNPHGPIPAPMDYGPPAQPRMHPYGGGMMPQEHRNEAPALSEAEFDEIMSRNRSVSSSAIARAISDAAAGEYTSAIETLVTAISLIKQSKAANDDRCKVLISSLQDTLHGIESKSFGSIRRDRSRSRDRERAHRRSRRERSRSREREYRERSRDRDRDRERERDRDKESRYYADNYARGERSRSRDRDRERDREREYREMSRDDRYYDERYRERERERDRDREREREPSRREPERERERDRDRDRERERAESSHRSSRH